MSLQDTQRNWDALGKKDPLWAVLSNGDKRDNKWDNDEFFETGVTEINGVLAYLNSLGALPNRRTALDFGCGVGRLTQALAPHFASVAGIDIAASMIALAQQYNRFGDKCRYVVNETGDLKLFPDNHFDLIYSNIVLQHIEPQYSAEYIKEFCRVLAPQGALLFQLPSEPSRELGLRQKIKRLLPPAALKSYQQKFGCSEISMNGIKKEEVLRIMEAAGAKIKDVQQDTFAQGWISFRYCATKE